MFNEVCGSRSVACMAGLGLRAAASAPATIMFWRPA